MQRRAFLKVLSTASAVTIPAGIEDIIDDARRILAGRQHSTEYDQAKQNAPVLRTSVLGLEAEDVALTRFRPRFEKSLANVLRLWRAAL